MDVEVTVTSASKKEESLAGAPAAIYVITSEDIRRSGLSSLPELLRLVPGMTVQHVNSHTWTVSTRGFNGFPNEKMLVLIDGRAVYDSLYGGVSWDTQALRLEDIDRIEVIRGPGGALWGANAVNGVINVVSKSASQTQGLAMSTSLGLNEGYQGSARFGDKTGNVSYRIYGRSSFWDPFVDSAGQEMFTSWHLSDGGMRTDWSLSANDALTIDAGGYQGHIRDTAMVANYDVSGIVQDPYSVQGGHILGRWITRFPQTPALICCRIAIGQIARILNLVASFAAPVTSKCSTITMQIDATLLSGVERCAARATRLESLFAITLAHPINLSTSSAVSGSTTFKSSPIDGESSWARNSSTALMVDSPHNLRFEQYGCQPGLTPSGLHYLGALESQHVMSTTIS
jgi:hypothetical protein